MANYAWAAIILPVDRSIRRLMGINNNGESMVSILPQYIQKNVVHFERYGKTKDIEAQVENSGRSTV